MKKYLAIVGLSVVSVLACIANPGVQAQHDALAEATGYSGEDLKDVRRELVEVLPFDKEAASRMDISVQKAKALPTAELIRAFVKSGTWVTILLYDDTNLGVYRLSQASPSLSELLSRKDFATGILKAYSTFNVDPKSSPEFTKENGVMTLKILEYLMAYRPVFSGFKGREKEILRAMCRQYWAMKRVNKGYAEKDRPYPECPIWASFGYVLEQQMGLSLPAGMRIDPVTKSVYTAKPMPANLDEIVKHFEAISS